MKSKRELQLERLLTQFIQPVRNIPFELIIQSLFDVSVEKFDPKAHKSALRKIAKALSQTCKTLKDNPIKKPRLNEAGNDIEKVVLSSIVSRKPSSGSRRQLKI